MKRLLLVMVLVLAAVPSLFADVHVKSKTHTDAMAMMGQNQPARDDVSESWYANGRFAQSAKDGGFIVDTAKNVAYMINHKDKSYVEMPLPIDFAKLLPPEAAPMAAMMKMTATVNPTTETKKIGVWDCTGYDAVLGMMGMQMNLKIWASTAVPFNIADFNSKIMPALLQGQMRLDEASAREFAKIKGFQIATELNADIMGAKMHTSSEVQEITEEPAPAGVYEPPAGYTKKATLSMQDLQRR